jgi:hypothetical protein
LGEPQLSNGKHRDHWVSIMDTYALPRIGERAAAVIEPGEIIDLLKPIWNSKEEAARRVLSLAQLTNEPISALTRLTMRRRRSLNRISIGTTEVLQPFNLQTQYNNGV